MPLPRTTKLTTQVLVEVGSFWPFDAFTTAHAQLFSGVRSVCLVCNTLTFCCSMVASVQAKVKEFDAFGSRCTVTVYENDMFDVCSILNRPPVGHIVLLSRFGMMYRMNGPSQREFPSKGWRDGNLGVLPQTEMVGPGRATQCIATYREVHGSN